MTTKRALQFFLDVIFALSITVALKFASARPVSFAWVAGFLYHNFCLRGRFLGIAISVLGKTTSEGVLAWFKSGLENA